ncbi:MAG: zinc ribbon domain-containing protein [Planctomycetaceae bacterium]|jgi:hypothetical protein|nr:zinc ribbon domain-containing protein [Planctomycetaceae bacterium]
MFCTNCGNEINENVIACPLCGTTIDASELTLPDNKNETAEKQPVIISKMIRTIFDKSITSTIGSGFAVLLGLPLLVLGIVFVFSNIIPIAMAFIPAMGRTLLIVTFIVTCGLIYLSGYPFLIGIQTLLKRKIIELTPDGLYYLNYGLSDDSKKQNAFIIDDYVLVGSQKYFLSWKEIHSIEKTEGKEYLKFKILRQEEEYEEHFLKLTGFDAAYETIYTNILDYHNRYKNGYTLVQDTTEQPKSAFQWNNSATWILFWGILYIGLSFFLYEDFFSEFTIVKSYDNFIENTIDELMGTEIDNDVPDIKLKVVSYGIIYKLPLFIFWFIIIMIMWRVIPYDTRKLNPYLAAFLSIFPCLWSLFNFFVIRGWAECINKTAGRNGQKNICIVGVVTCCCIAFLVIAIVGEFISAHFLANFEKFLNDPEYGENFYFTYHIGQIVTIIFLLYVVNCVRLLNPPIQSNKTDESEMNFSFLTTEDTDNAEKKFL